MFKIEWSEKVVLEFFNCKKGEFRLNHYELFKDQDGYYVQKRTRSNLKKIYLNSENCLNLVDIKKSI